MSNLLTHFSSCSHSIGSHTHTHTHQIHVPPVHHSPVLLLQQRFPYKVVLGGCEGGRVLTQNLPECGLCAHRTALVRDPSLPNCVLVLQTSKQ